MAQLTTSTHGQASSSLIEYPRKLLAAVPSETSSAFPFPPEFWTNPGFWSNWSSLPTSTPSVPSESSISTSATTSPTSFSSKTSTSTVATGPTSIPSTTEKNPRQSMPLLNNAAMAGVFTVVGLISMAIAIAVYLCLRRRRTKMNARAGTSSITPFTRNGFHELGTDAEAQVPAPDPPRPQIQEVRNPVIFVANAEAPPSYSELAHPGLVSNVGESNVLSAGAVRVAQSRAFGVADDKRRIAGITNPVPP